MHKYKFVVNDNRFLVEELALDYEIPKTPDSIVLHESEKYDCLTRILVNDYTGIYIYWISRESYSRTIEMLVVPEKYMMFIGVGQLSAQINLNCMELKRERLVNSFEYFSQYENCVIEKCFGECTAFTLDGEIIARHELGMFWSVDHDEDGWFCTICDDNGKRRLVKIK